VVVLYLFENISLVVVWQLTNKPSVEVVAQTTKVENHDRDQSHDAKGS